MHAQTIGKCVVIEYVPTDYSYECKNIVSKVVPGDLNVLTVNKEKRKQKQGR